MQYLVIMGILIVVAVILIVIIITALMRSRQKDEDDYEDDEDYDEGYDDEAEVEENPNRKREAQHRQREQGAGNEGPHVIGQSIRSQDGAGNGQNKANGDQDGKRVPGKKLWKLVLENLSTWQKSTFIFYENIGIGRGHSVPQFEKFLSVGDDLRVSKLHCAIIQKDDKLYLKDMGSKNGTYLNGKRITQPVLLQRDDIISMGETEIEVQSMMREK